MTQDMKYSSSGRMKISAGYKPGNNLLGAEDKELLAIVEQKVDRQIERIKNETTRKE